MKMTNVLKTGLCAVLALSFAGCKIATGTDFSVVAENRALVADNTLNSGVGASFSLASTSWTTAGSNTTSTVTIASYNALDEESIEAALNFYSLQDNSSNKYAYPTRANTLPKTKMFIAVTENSGIVNTVIDYIVDSSSVTTDAVAVMLDAAALKDKSGNLILNNDGNDKAGEESDSLIEYITVSYKKDGSATTALYGIPNEDFCPTISTTLSEDTSEIGAGKLKYSIAAPQYKKADNTDEWDGELKSIYDQIFLFYTLASDATEWTSTPMVFEYDSTTHVYTSKVDYPALGTQYKVVLVSKPDLADTKTASYYGHQGKVTFKTVEEYSIANDGAASPNNFEGTASYYGQSPDYIINDSGVTFASGVYSENAITTAQKTFLSASAQSGSAPLYFDVTVTGKLSAYEDFLIFDANGNKVASKVYVLAKDSDGDVIKVRVAAENPNYYTASCELYVGKGTTLKTNTDNPTQLKFGFNELREDLYSKGYIQLN